MFPPVPHSQEVQKCNVSQHFHISRVVWEALRSFSSAAALNMDLEAH